MELYGISEKRRGSSMSHARFRFYNRVRPVGLSFSWRRGSADRQGDGRKRPLDSDRYGGISGDGQAPKTGRYGHETTRTLHTNRTKAAAEASIGDEAKSFGSLLRRVIAEKGSVEIPSNGVSMFPLIREGDRCVFGPIDPERIKKGDIYLFESEDGALHAHRLSNIFHLLDDTILMFRGDARLTADKPVRLPDLIGKLVRIQKKRIVLSADGWPARLWGRLALHGSLANRLLTVYLFYKERKGAARGKRRNVKTFKRRE